VVYLHSTDQLRAFLDFSGQSIALSRVKKWHKALVILICLFCFKWSAGAQSCNNSLNGLKPLKVVSVEIPKAELGPSVRMVEDLENLSPESQFYIRLGSFKETSTFLVNNNIEIENFNIEATHINEARVPFVEVRFDTYEEVTDLYIFKTNTGDSYAISADEMARGLSVFRKNTTSSTQENFNVSFQMFEKFDQHRERLSIFAGDVNSKVFSLEWRFKSLPGDGGLLVTYSRADTTRLFRGSGISNLAVETILRANPNVKKMRLHLVETNYSTFRDSFFSLVENTYSSDDINMDLINFFNDHEARSDAEIAAYTKSVIEQYKNQIISAIEKTPAYKARARLGFSVISEINIGTGEDIYTGQFTGVVYFSLTRPN